MVSDDLRSAWRQARKAPGFATTAVLTLAVAIGANAAVFSLVDAVLLKPLPYPGADRLAIVSRDIAREGVLLDRALSHTGAVWEAIRDHATTVDAAVLSGLSSRVSLVAGRRTVSVAPQRVSAGYFAVLGVPPAMGREFSADEDRVGGPAVAVLSHRLWRTALDADPSVLGRAILLKGEPHVVVGIMPEGFHTDTDADLWTPVRPSRTGEGGGENYGIVARLHDGVTWAQAGAEMAAVADGALARPEGAAGITQTHALMPLQEGLTGDVRRPLLLLWGAVGVVLVVACVNLAGLLLARASRRTREIATRLAIGAGRGAVVRQLLVESLLLAIVGGAAGLLLGAGVLEGLKWMASDLLAPWRDAALDGRVVGITVAVAGMTALAFGLVPALHATRLDVLAALSEGGTRAVAGGARGWPRRALVVAEVALGVVLLVGAGLLTRTFLALEATPTGFDPRNLVIASASLDDARYASHEAIDRLFDESLARVRALPGVEGAAVSLGVPYERILNMGAVRIGGDGQGLFTTVTYVSPGYFETMRLPVRQGRPLDETDGAGRIPAIVVNEAFARRYLNGRDAVGEHFRVAGVERAVVGVSADVPQQGGFNGYGPLDALPCIYIPFAQFPSQGLRVFHGWFSPAWIVREASPGMVTDAVLRRAIGDVDPQLAVTPARGVDAVRAEALSRQRLLMTLVAMLGLSALLLAAIGIHGVIASGVAERRRELGIRMALGATVTQTVAATAVPGIVMAVAGLAIGSLAALGAVRWLQALLWGVKGADPITFAAVLILLLAVAVTASVVPALRVRRFDPVSLLRE